MNFLKVLTIAFLAVFFSSDAYAQFVEGSPSCSDQFTMRIERSTHTNANRKCYIVWIESTDGQLLENVFAASYNGHCTTNFSGSDDRFGAVFCFGANSCEPPNTALGSEQTIWCGINDAYGNMLCRDGCTVTLDDY